jgi:hypothetical protein
VNPLGIKGIGELGNVGTNAAVANVVYHATGIRVRDLPIRLENFWLNGYPFVSKRLIGRETRWTNCRHIGGEILFSEASADGPREVPFCTSGDYGKVPTDCRIGYGA